MHQNKKKFCDTQATICLLIFSTSSKTHKETKYYSPSCLWLLLLLLLSSGKIPSGILECFKGIIKPSTTLKDITFHNRNRKESPILLQGPDLLNVTLTGP